MDRNQDMDRAQEALRKASNIATLDNTTHRLADRDYLRITALSTLALALFKRWEN